MKAKIWKLRQSPTRGWMITIGARDYLLPHDLAAQIYAAHKDDIYTATADRDSLAAENAELRNEVERWKEGTNHEMIMGDSARKRLFAANATLASLREVVPEGEGRSWSMLDAAYNILYPQPKETNDDNH